MRSGAEASSQPPSSAGSRTASAADHDARRRRRRAARSTWSLRAHAAAGLHARCARASGAERADRPRGSPAAVARAVEVDEVQPRAPCAGDSARAGATGSPPVARLARRSALQQAHATAAAQVDGGASSSMQAAPGSSQAAARRRCRSAPGGTARRRNCRAATTAANSPPYSQVASVGRPGRRGDSCARNRRSRRRRPCGQRRARGRVRSRFQPMCGTGRPRAASSRVDPPREAGPGSSVSSSALASYSSCMPRQMPSTGCVSVRQRCRPDPAPRSRAIASPAAPTPGRITRAASSQLGGVGGQARVRRRGARTRSAPRRCSRRRVDDGDRRHARLTARPWCSAAPCPRGAPPGAARGRRP